MATSIPGGPIVTVPGPDGGAGAAVITSEIINAKWENAVTMINAGFALSDDALAIAGTAPYMQIPELDKAYKPPGPPDLPDLDPNEGLTIFNNAKKANQDLVTQGFANFLSSYFPNGTYYTAALAWLDKAISEGGTGISTDVESALWERGRSRVMGDVARAEAEATVAWARRRMPLPPGAMVNQLQTIQQDGRNKLAEVNRDITVKSFDAELENTRFAVKTAVDLRTKAIDSAGDYIRTLMLGPQNAADLARTLVGLKTDFSRNLIAMYQAEVTALEPGIRLAIADAQIKSDGERANLNSKISTIEARLRAALANAGLVASWASASLNGINASAGITGSDSSQV